MIDGLRSLIGSPPAGYELYEYLIAGVLLLLVVKIVIDVFFYIFRRIMKW